MKHSYNTCSNQRYCKKNILWPSEYATSMADDWSTTSETDPCCILELPALRVDPALTADEIKIEVDPSPHRCNTSGPLQVPFHMDPKDRTTTITIGDLPNDIFAVFIISFSCCLHCAGHL